MNKTNRFIAVSLIALAISGGLLSLPAQAAQKSSAAEKLSAAAEKSKSLRQEKAEQEIDRRIKALTNLSARVSAMKKVSAGTEQGVAQTVQDQIKSLTELKAKIAAESDLEAIKTDVQSITKSYRIYALVIPQGTVLAASDRALNLADALDILANKLDSRLAARSDADTLRASLAQMRTQIAAARQEAQTASSSVSALTPDEGDAAHLQSNLAALKAARKNIQDAHDQLLAARQEAASIIAQLKAASASSTETPAIQE